ncbi:PREDICTED: polygalacturonase-like [Brassica oleracea var. oleracea]|uniref:polygalacturonase-like n=1 Tax=Brassica oleracea var. oleracea TaxID=109376 RepID=UPI0006A73124|nr:PREDICTED: polygalacturonase-like [Brassica oleracea var. oleracea]
MEKFQCTIMFAYLLMSTTIFSSLPIQSHATKHFNVLSFGAKPNGIVDSATAFAKAWDAACSSTEAAVIYVSKGRYLVSPVRFSGESCKSLDIVFRIDGTLVGSGDYNFLGREETWFSFERVTGVSVIGGSFDAKGPSLWACKASSNNSCPAGATTISFVESSRVKVKGLLSLNSQMFHIVINRCRNVKINDIRIVADGKSPNTDGIHVQLSTDVEIRNASIKTGDDCISIGPGTKNLWVERVTCGPGHGISIGSLGKDREEEGVQNVTVKKTVFVGTDNGLRIKSWANPSSGFVQRVRFLESLMFNVKGVIESGVSEENTNHQMMDSVTNQKDQRIKDMTALHMLQMSVTDSIFLRIGRATSSKQAWEILEVEFGETNEIHDLKLAYL